MLVKLAALGALGYVGYRYLQQAQADAAAHGTGTGSATPRQIAVAGGPLSDQATIQSNSDTPPATGAAGPAAAGEILSTMP